MSNYDKKCVICGTHYKYCENCPSKFNTSQTWRNIFCSENCRELYNVYDSLKAERISESDACNKMKKLDTSNIENNPIGIFLSTIIDKDNIVFNEPKKNNRRKKTNK